ncbi:ExbD/TolR family protein [Burkholderia oklahomensis]|uniref:Biopolymer transport ExbD/TolR family protein n=1 Tax=Burkholderia oklahomensis TaxID=342113 RepID=A0AAI8BD71_9BURK|nr:biopolymer transporter ExbD [Burkholderia oklahomensis]AIO70063.1 biopolymer transport ExbD/TolR family protein [Burkholderia oklahomensis]AJX35461.1 biopolymer transport ExbD/TolR family protein [Burkholderia oklahomensis C6786]AOI40418.1 biopolymer transporter ExbD [Burkholderia oklahomensis EO147]AOI50048.1 biopolymer transporter ExbD [Burkholderia oklahomensis C6786]KUY52943.1 biopolymer transporter ExbD [Burkholderia oklahomensis EO147]
MGMNVSSSGGGEPDVMVDINTTPLIDVMLVLLIMLIITIPIQMHSIKMNLPIGNPPPPATQPEIVQIDIDFDGTTTWNGAPVPNRAALEAKLAQVAAEPVQAEIHLRPNKLVPYKDVAAVLASAQRIGATKIGLIGNEQYMQ